MKRNDDTQVTPTATDDLDALNAAARNWHRDAQASDDLTRNVRAAVRSRRQRALLPAPRFSRPALATLCAATILGASIGLSALRPPSALAAVRQAMRQVRTARWTDMTQTRALPGGTLLRTVRGSTTVDLTRLAARVETGVSEVYIRTPSGVYWKRDGVLIPGNRAVTTEELANDLRRRLLPEVRRQGRESEWQVSAEVREGRPVHHFVLKASPDAPAPVEVSGGATQDEFWTDVATNRIIATRYAVLRQEGDKMVEDVFTTSNYEYDMNVPEGLFKP